jgi:lipid II:glycine glycyltransferase (peptidoglycan interpeptide bridge formation enzyme)
MRSIDFFSITYTKFYPAGKELNKFVRTRKTHKLNSHKIYPDYLYKRYPRGTDKFIKTKQRELLKSGQDVRPHVMLATKVYSTNPENRPQWASLSSGFQPLAR